MKNKIFIFFIFFFSFIPGALAIDLDYDQNDASGKLLGKPSSSTLPVEKSEPLRAGMEVAFCSPNKLSPNLEEVTLTRARNKIVVETFANWLGGDIRDKYKVTGKTIALGKDGEQREAYNELESRCLKVRSKNEEEAKKIDNLYKQVKFFETYYNVYPKELKTGVMPGFLIFLIDGIESLSLWLVWITLFNLMFWVFLYGFSSEKKKYNSIKKIKYAFLYILLVFIVKIGIFGGVFALIGYSNIDFFKLFFNF